MKLVYTCQANFSICCKIFERFDFDPEWSLFCAIQIYHRGRRVNKETKEELPPVLTLDADFVTQMFNGKVQEWKASTACEKLKSILSLAAKDHKIDKVIGFALGDFATDLGPDSLHIRHQSASQHAILLTLEEWLQERDRKENVPCYVQDPVYNSIDQEILGNVGIEVIDDPRGWLEIDEQSMMITVAPNVPVKEIIADIARPAVIIWHHVGFRDGLREEARR